MPKILQSTSVDNNGLDVQHSYTNVDNTLQVDDAIIALHDTGRKLQSVPVHCVVIVAV